MTKTELIKALEDVDDDEIICCKDEFGGWDNIIEVERHQGITFIIFGGGSPFSDE